MKTEKDRAPARPEEELSPEEQRLAQTLAAAVALKTTRPVKPAADSLARITARLAVPQPARRGALVWIAAAGWMAAALAVGFLFHLKTSSRERDVASAAGGTSPAATPVVRALRQPQAFVAGAWPAQAVDAAPRGLDSMMPSLRFMLRPAPVAAGALSLDAPNVSVFASSSMLPYGAAGGQGPVPDQTLGVNIVGGAAAAGVAVTGNSSLVNVQSQSPGGIAMAPPPGGLPGIVAGEGAVSSEAVPVALAFQAPEGLVDYDASTDKGQVALSGLAPLAPGKVYRLYVLPKGEGTQALLLGELPGAPEPQGEAYAFKLGGPGRLPAGFYLTMEDASARGGFDAANLILRS